MTGFAPTANYAGTNSDRQSIGLPGHCERCAERGHVAAHPGYGCGDVGCNLAHEVEPAPVRTLTDVLQDFRAAARGESAADSVRVPVADLLIVLDAHPERPNGH